MGRVKSEGEHGWKELEMHDKGGAAVWYGWMELEMHNIGGSMDVNIIIMDGIRNAKGGRTRSETQSRLVLIYMPGTEWGSSTTCRGKDARPR